MENKNDDFKECTVCGMPLASSTKIRWYPNGIISSPQAKGLRYVFLENDDLKNLYDKLGERLGAPLDLLIRNAKEIITVYFLDYILPLSSKIILKLGRKIKPFRERLFEKASAPISNIFWGVFEKAEFKKEKIEMVIKNPVYLPLMIGGMAGTLQYFYGCKSTGIDYDYDENGEILKITLWPEQKELEVKKHIPKPVSISETKTLAGNIPYSYCSHCGALKDLLGAFTFNAEEGKLFETRAKKRILAMTAHCHNAILTAIERQLGKEISVMAMEIEKEYSRENFPAGDLQGSEEDYKNLFIPFFFGLRGWGNAVEVKKEDKKLKVRIDNPFNEIILAGVIGGIYEAIERIEAQVQWTPNTQGYTVVTVSPKQ